MNRRYFLILILLISAAIGAVYRILNRPPQAELSLNEKVQKILLSGGCVSCHTDQAELPFYASLPIAKDLISKDIEQGYRAYDIAPLLQALQEGSLPNPVDVAKVEKVALDKRMPMAKYYLVHWGSQMTSAKRDIIAEWAKVYREEYYGDNLGKHSAEPIRPIDLNVEVDESKAALGRLLYHDTRLSVDNTISCASCHGLETAGVDNKPFSEGVEGKKGGVNAPTVYNAAYNFVQFWDGRASTLAEQAAGPPLNPVEMASPSFDDIVGKLSADKALTKAFTEVYPEGWSQESITDAIEMFERTLITPNSRFDKYLRGDDEAITQQELKGYELFKKYDCATCHIGKNLGGESYELMGLREHYFAERGTDLTEEDNGRFKQTQNERDRHRFKVPGLRNIELTWPYYHDGTRSTLQAAVQDMGRYQSGVELSPKETEQIVAFLKTLTGEYEEKPLTNKNPQP